MHKETGRIPFYTENLTISGVYALLDPVLFYTTTSKPERLLVFYLIPLAPKYFKGR